MTHAIRICVVFRRTELFPEIRLLCQEGKENILLQIQVSLLHNGVYFFLGQAAVLNTKSLSYLIEIHTVCKGNLLIAITLPVFINRKQHPACSRVPVLERIRGI